MSLALCFAVVLGAAISAGAQASASSARGVATSSERTWRLTLSPQPDNLALTQIEFHVGRAQRITPATLSLLASKPFGANYIAAATPRRGTPGTLRVLVLIVNRPSPLLDPVAVSLRLRARRSWGSPLIWKLSDPFGHPSGGLTPALCDVPLGGPALAASQLRALRSQGVALVGFDAAGAVAQAYDVACGLPYEADFAQDVTATPAPRPPLCTPCDPAPGYACPLQQPDICAAPAADAARRLPAAAH